ncbi:hypothetical protein H0H93_006969, partial [Arthromyces matolae]
ATPEAVVAPAVEEKKDEEKKDEEKVSKAKRRISFAGFFKSKPKAEVATPAKVDEHPPKIEEPAPVAPLENPASEPVAE